MRTASSLLFLFVGFKSVESKYEGRAARRQGTTAEAQANQSLLQFTIFSFAARSSQERKTTAHCLVCMGNKTESKYRYKIDSNTEEGWRGFWPTFLSITTPV